MLTVTRRRGDSITITAGDHIIRVHVKTLMRGQVRIGIEADESVSILRSELKGQSHDNPLAKFLGMRKAS